MPSTFSGIYPVLYTFFDPIGRIDRAAMQREVDVCIAAGARGVTILGIAGESVKMDVNERRQLLEIVAEAVAGRVPLAPILNEMSIPGQIEFARAAETLGAAMLILQPPQIKGIPEPEVVRFIGQVADKVSKPVAVQNNPVNLEVALTIDSLKTINRNHPNVTLLKGEAGVLDIQRLIEETAGAFEIFSGLGGRELPLTYGVGCVGCMPAPDWVDVQSNIHRLLESGQEGDNQTARSLHASILPAIQFTVQAPTYLLCYGKQMFATRAGLGDVHLRAPSLRPTRLGLDIVKKFASAFPPLTAEASAPRNVRIA